MNQKNLFLTLAIFVFSLNQTFSQSPATDKGSHLISGIFSFTSQGGDLYQNFNDESLITIFFSPSYYNFVADKIGIGGDVSLSRISQGDFDITTFGIGPKFAYFFDSGSNAIPFVGAGINYLSVGADGDNESGSRIKIGGGVMVRKGHLGLSFEAGWMRDSYKPEGASDAITGSTIFIGAGLAGFLYKG